ncbi:uncharacterized protein PHALS_00821 [Plasmopara halstedii]|uniref:Uncharacterized protein n=1 Tax=Plasmopara halstedii TaxID=4781 RepID=A0A0P1ATA5_PLAHL|nr:uncharacterized protein PHALS_00821 [Plasmopara halstedii]CEG44457.1 hypothetical protein PHALS_00821 [Plasmopara halstedii]|eukprot:XP_024580826.1 hypothetical protein PHALS_00821 [Plasmopara halstedii]
MHQTFCHSLSSVSLLTPTSADLDRCASLRLRTQSGVSTDSSAISDGLEAFSTSNRQCNKTIGHQLVLYRVHSTHQVMVMSTDLHCASLITLDDDGAKNQEDTRLLRLGINGTTITLRAVTHRAAEYWVDGLQRIRDGKPLRSLLDPPACTESEDKLFDEIDEILSLRKCSPPSSSRRLCGLSIMARELENSSIVMLHKAELSDRDASAGCKIC